MTEKHGWLNVIYRLPSKPSTLRVSVWKQVKELGGLPLQQSTYAFPDRSAVREGLARIQRQVESGGGEAVTFEIPSLDATTEASFVAELARLRDEEYAETLEDCEELARRLARKTGREHFDREEVADARDDLVRIRTHVEAIIARDYLGGTRRAETEARLQACEGLVTAFAKRTADAGATDEPVTETAVPPKHLKQQERHECDASEAIALARRTLDELSAGTLAIGEQGVGAVGRSAVVDLKYSDRNGRRCLEIEIEW